MVVCEGENGNKARAHFVLKPKEDFTFKLGLLIIEAV